VPVISWPRPTVPSLPGRGHPVALHDTATGLVRPLAPGPTATMYVCGITPYDATHLGHAATYVTFDVLGRALRDSGHDVRYVQNVTDVDDPLLERAARDGLGWSELATREIDLFREDMTALRVIPPDDFPGVVESMDLIVRTVRSLVESGRTYTVEDDEGGPDVYLDLRADPLFGSVSSWTLEEMLTVYEDRGGDPRRAGKRDALDPLLWRAARSGEPSWDGGPLGPGRPGWHVECTALAAEYLDIPFDVQGGGTDLVFPHHEMSASQSRADGAGEIFARCYTHQAMVGFDGAKMSKSRGNLVLVSALRANGVDPMEIRLALLDHHYRTDWEWTDEGLASAASRADDLRKATSLPEGPTADVVLGSVRSAVAHDLDTPRALRAFDAWTHEALTRGGSDPSAPGIVRDLLDALLGVRLVDA
jgi:L-cysteine:1D-myo-inositol 2-amino-2-deoxy-alpha-D-glucopyranoside ligase